jgi:hypothetical protein
MAEMAPHTQMPAAGRVPTGLVGAVGIRYLPGSTVRRPRGPIRSHCAVAVT